MHCWKYATNVLEVNLEHKQVEANATARTITSGMNILSIDQYKLVRLLLPLICLTRVNDKVKFEREERWLMIKLLDLIHSMLIFREKIIRPGHMIFIKLNRVQFRCCFYLKSIDNINSLWYWDKSVLMINCKSSLVFISRICYILHSLSLMIKNTDQEHV
jgi:hypothetical protein